jgi:NADPH:quinone reductase-like Zn-dependent oxidoreductase
VVGFKIGDRVISNFDPTYLYGQSQGLNKSLGGSIDGMLCQYRALPYFSLIKIADHLTYEEAASLVCAGVTAWNALHGNNRLLPGQSVLLQGTGGVSLCGLVLARAAGCTTIITSSSDEKLKEVKEKYGVDYTINYKTKPNWDEEVLKVTNGKGVDIILENGGVGTIEKSINSIKLGGIIACIGFLSAEENATSPNVTLLTLMKACVIRGIHVGSREQTEQLMNLIDQKKLNLPVTKVFNSDLESIKQAYQYLQSQSHIGKICIKIEHK